MHSVAPKRKLINVFAYYLILIKFKEDLKVGKIHCKNIRNGCE